MEKFKFKMSPDNAVFKESTTELKDNLGTPILISGYGAGSVIDIEEVEVDGNKLIQITVQVEFKYPWATHSLHYYLQNLTKISCDSDNEVIVWSLERSN